MKEEHQGTMNARERLKTALHHRQLDRVPSGERWEERDMKGITAVLLGAGQRGAGAYATYALEHPEELRFVAVAEPDKARREEFRAMHGLDEAHCFESWQDLLARPRLADAVLVCTQDDMHFEPTVMALEKDYHVLLEKPMSNDAGECIAMGDLALRKNRVFSVCHVLRHTPFFESVKKILDEGKIGDIVSIQHTENVAYWHQAHSFVRGNWRRSEESSPMILAKSCHDMDILLWLVGSDCTKVSSFGSLLHFRKENAPEGAPQHCLEGCPVQDDCPYFAPRIYLDRERGWISDVLRKVVSIDPSDESVMKALEKRPYGRCVYRCDNDVVDHQVVNLEFASGATVAFTMCAFTYEGGRSIKIMGTKGQIRCDMDRNVIETTDFLTHACETLHPEGTAGGHGGGDAAIMRDFVDLVRSDGKKSGRSAAHLSIQGHLMAFAAETSRLEGRVVEMSAFVDSIRGSWGNTQ
jgi:predicted dehydrogenase